MEGIFGACSLRFTLCNDDRSYVLSGMFGIMQAIKLKSEGETIECKVVLTFATNSEDIEIGRIQLSIECAAAEELNTSQADDTVSRVASPPRSARSVSNRQSEQLASTHPFYYKKLTGSDAERVEASNGGLQLIWKLPVPLTHRFDYTGQKQVQLLGSAIAILSTGATQSAVGTSFDEETVHWSMASTENVLAGISSPSTKPYYIAADRVLSPSALHPAMAKTNASAVVSTAKLQPKKKLSRFSIPFRRALDASVTWTSSSTGRSHFLSLQMAALVGVSIKSLEIVTPGVRRCRSLSKSGTSITIEAGEQYTSIFVLEGFRGGWTPTNKAILCTVHAVALQQKLPLTIHYTLSLLSTQPPPSYPPPSHTQASLDRRASATTSAPVETKSRSDPLRPVSGVSSDTIQSVSLSFKLLQTCPKPGTVVTIEALFTNHSPAHQHYLLLIDPLCKEEEDIDHMKLDKESGIIPLHSRITDIHVAGLASNSFMLRFLALRVGNWPVNGIRVQNAPPNEQILWSCDSGGIPSIIVVE